MPPFFVIAKVVSSLLPTFFVLHQGFNQVRVVLELRVHHLNVFIVFSKKSAETHERRPYFLS